MSFETDPNRLLTPNEANEMLRVSKRFLEWKEKQHELALPVQRISPRKRRYRYGDVALVTSGQRPLLKSADEPGWTSPYAVEIKES